MPILHWFFSLGTAERDARYVLTDEVRARLVDYFPKITTAYNELDSAHYAHVSRSTTSSLLQLCGPPTDGLRFRSRLFPTKEVVERGIHRACIQDAPEW